MVKKWLYPFFNTNRYIRKNILVFTLLYLQLYLMYQLTVCTLIIFYFYLSLYMLS